MVPFLYDGLFYKLIKKLLRLIVKSGVLEKCMPPRDLKHINLEHESVLMKLKDLNTVFPTTSFTTVLKREDIVSSTQLANFYNDAINIITCFVQKLFEQTP